MARSTLKPSRLRKRSASDDAHTLSEFVRVLEGKEIGGGDVANPAAKVVAVYACVRKKANAIAMLSLRISTADDEVVENGPLAQLAERPAPGMTGRAFFRAFSAFLDLFGLCYLVKRIEGNTLLGVLPVSPIEITEVREGGAGLISHYNYTPFRSGTSITLSPEEVHPVIDPDFGSGDLERPLSPRHAASLAIRQHHKADIANDQSLEHGAGGAMGLRTDGKLSEPQRVDIRRELEDRHAGYRNRHRWMLLEGGLTPEKLFSTFQEMEFTELKFFSREDICVAYDINPLVLGYGGREGLGSGQHTEAAHVITWTDTHLPRAEWMAEEFMRCIAPHFDANASLSLRDARKRKLAVAERSNRHRRELLARAAARGNRFFAWFDHSGVSILQKAALDLAKQAAEWSEKGVPLNQLLAAYDLPFEEVPWGNTWWRPFGLIDVQDEQATAPGSGDPDGSPPPDDEPEPDEGDVDVDRGHRHTPTRTQPSRDDVPAHVRNLSAAQLERLWMSWRASWQGLERQLASRHSRHVNELRRGVLQRLHEQMPEGKALSITADRAKDIIGEILFDLVEADRQLIARAGPLLREAYRLGGEQVRSEHAAATGQPADDVDPFNIEDPNLARAMQRREIKVKGTNRTLRRRLRDQIAEGLASHEPVSKVAERIRKEFNLAAGRSNTIARTEIAGAVEDSRQVGRGQLGVPHKSWLWSRKETGRPWHMAAEDQYLRNPIANDAEFVLPQTGGRALYPRAGTLEVEDVANCGCTTISRYPDDQVADGRMFDALTSRGFLTCEQMQQRDVKSSAAA